MERKVCAGFAELCPACGKVRGESVAPGTTCPSPEVAEACAPVSVPLGPQQQRVGAVPSSCLVVLSAWAMTGIVQREAGDLKVTGQDNLTLSRGSELLGCTHCCRGCHRGNGDLPVWGAEGATSWPSRAALVTKGSGDSCEAFGSCRSNLQPLPVGGLHPEGAFQSFGKADSNRSFLGGVSALSSAMGSWVHRAPTSRTATRQPCGLAPTPHSGGPGCGPW